MHTLLQDLRYAMRQMRKSPGFTLTAVLTLALGIGATTAIFTLINAVLLKSLPVKDPASLWRVGDTNSCCVDSGLPSFDTNPNDWSLFSYEQYREFRDNTPGFASLAAFQASQPQMAVRRAGSHHAAQPMYGEMVSGNAFSTLGLRAYAGRLLQPSDDRDGAPAVAVMSYQAWQQQYGGNPSIIGANFLVNNMPVTIVGIAPPGFYGEELRATPPSLWFPLHMITALDPQQDLLHHPEEQWLNLFGRLAPGATTGAVQARMIVELQQFLKNPQSGITGPAIAMIPHQYLRIVHGGGGVQRMQSEYESDLHLLMWISSFVLLIACANLANLMLARSIARRQQVSVRMALGAPRRRLVQRALIESLALAVMGGFAGLLVAWGGARLILHLAFRHNTLQAIQVSPSLPVLGFAFLVSLLTGVLFGVAPAWLAAHADPIEALRGANRSTGRRSLLLQKSLVIAQSSVSVVLLCAAGLLIVSLNKLEHQNFGFKTAHRYVVHIDPQTAGYQPAQLDALYWQLDGTLAAIPGVARVSYSLASPLDGYRTNTSVYVEGLPAPPPESEQNLAGFDRVSPGYFATIGSKIIAGRGFTRADNRNSAPVAVVNQAFVREVLHGKPAIGAHFGDWDPNVKTTFEIVGIVQDAKYQYADRAVRPMFFEAAAQWASLPATDPQAANDLRYVDSTHYMRAIEIETHGRVPGLEAKVRAALAGVNPNLIMIRFDSMSEMVRQALSWQNMIAQLTSLFGALALVLAAIGLYGVTAYAVAQRTREIGVRMALGANRGNVLQMVLRGAFLQTGIGVLVGIPAAIVAGQMMTSSLFGVEVWNPAVLLLTVAVLALATVIAALIPARRAAAVEPMQALRSE